MGVQTMAISSSLPEAGFLRLKQIIGDKKTGTPGVLPIGRTSFLNGVKTGKFPRPVKLSERTVGWRAEDIRRLIASIGT